MLDENNVIKLIKDFYELELPTTIFRRDIELPLDIRIPRAIAVIGPRRAGKSYLLFYTMKRLLERGVKWSNMLYVNFEDPAFEHALHAELPKIIEIFFKMYPEKRQEKLWLFLDEIQEIAGWERFARNMIDKPHVQIFITGSSSKLMSKEIATSMRGRTVTYRLLTLSFSEFLEFKGIERGRFLSSSQESRIAKAASEYLEFGGYPETVIYAEERERLLSELLDVTLQRDIVERYGVRNIKILRLLIKTIATSSEFSTHKFFNFLKSNGYKISKNTLYRYIQALADAFAVQEVKKYSRSPREEEQSLSKMYMLDNGLLKINNVSGSKLFENAVFNALFRNEKYIVTYYKDQSTDVDFVVSENGAVKALVQACFDMSDLGTRDRELRALISASKKLGCNNLIVVTMNEKRTEKYKGRAIHVVPLWEFMLSK